ncbi:hypothetical protein Tco_1275704 [Tanacetum coccineum]
MVFMSLYQAAIYSWASQFFGTQKRDGSLWHCGTLLALRCEKILKETGRNLNFSKAKNTVGFDLDKGCNCYNCHMRRSTLLETCRGHPLPQGNQGNRNGDGPRRNAPVDTSTTNALVVQDGIGSLEARIVVLEKNKAIYEEDIAFLKYDVQVKDIFIKDLKNQLEEALKEKDDLKLKLEKFEESSKNLTKLINSQINAKDKAGLGYDSQMNESEVVHSMFNSGESDVDNSPINDIFKTGKGFHAVPLPYIGNYMPLRPDLSFAGLDDSVYKTKDTDSDNNSVFRPKTDQIKPKFTKINFVKSDENVKSVNKENTHKQVEYFKKSQSLREKPVLNNKGRVTGQREIRPVWNNVQWVNHQNKLTHPHPKRNFVPTVVATKLRQVPVNAAKQNSARAAALISTARPINTVSPKSKVNDALPKTYSYFKAHSPVRRAFNQKSAAKTYNLNEKVKTARVNNVTTTGPKAVVSTAVGYGENAVKSSACWIWRPTGNVIDHTSKDSGSYMFKRFNYVDLQGRLKSDQGIFNSRCSRHMTGNKSFLTDYQEVDGGFIAFAGSPKGDPLGKFDGKADEGFFVGYSINRKAFRVFNTRTRKVEENLHITFLENKPNVVGSGPDWLFDIDLLTNSMNYEPVTVGNQTNKNACIKDNTQQYILLLLLYDNPKSSEDAVADDASKKTNEEQANKGERNGKEKEGGASNKEDDQNVQDFRAALDNLLVQQKEGYANSNNRDSTVSPSVSAARKSFTNVDNLPTDPLMLDLEDTANLLNTGIFSGAYDDEDMGAEADLNNLETTKNASPIPITRIHKSDKALLTGRRNLNSEPKKVTQALTDPSWIEAMQDELLQFRLQKVMQRDDGIFISQDKYVDDILKKFDFVTMKTTSTPIETHKALLKDEEDENVDVHLYRSMIGSLMYLTASRPDIMNVVCACARFQVTPKVSHLHTVKRIFRYLKGQPKLGLWYPRDSPFDLEAFSDSDYAGASLDRKSTTGGCQFLGKRLILWQCKKQTIVANSTTKAEYVAAANCRRQVLWIKNQMLDYGFNFMNTKIYIDNENETVIKEWEDRMERAATTASSLEAEQNSGSGPRCQDTILGGAEAQTRFEATSKQSNDPPLSRVNRLGSGEDNMKLKELIEFCTKLSERALDL